MVKKIFVACSPRLSIVIPNKKIVRGYGVIKSEYQINIPISKRLSEDFVVHFNAGLNIFPNHKTNWINSIETTKTLTDYIFGCSVIWLTSQNFNFLFEYKTFFEGTTDFYGNKYTINTNMICPGIRYAFDIGDLQIVPGCFFLVHFWRLSIYWCNS